MNLPWVEQVLAAGRVQIDSRRVEPGDVFVALPGERVDGHDFLAQVKARGAVAAVVSRVPQVDLPYYLVPDTRMALMALGKAHRDKFTMPMIALTGSSGKTTVKSMIASILSEVGPTFYTPGNYNTNIGVPLSLLQLNAQHQFAVIELGANHLGEIAELVRLVKPNIALINNIGSAHIGEFGSIDNIIKAKSEIFSQLRSTDTAVFDLEYDFTGNYQSICFGQTHAADYQLIAENTVRTPQGEFTFELSLLGKHNQLNAVAAIAVTGILGIPIAAQIAGLKKIQAIPGRLERKAGRAGAVILDDTYNANLNSMKAALDVLASYPGRRIFVMGDMGELGEYAQQHHQAVGEYARALQIEEIYTCGTLSQLAGGQPFASPAQLQLDSHTVVLVKGSRGAKMENIVAQIVE